jgi:hypothetical protein
LEILHIAIKALAVIANLGQQTRSNLRAGARQGTKQVMIGMPSEKFFDSLPI